MKRLLCLAATFTFLYTTPAYAGGSVETENFVNQSGRAPTGALFLGNTQLKGRLGAFAFGYINKNWGQAYGGPTLILVEPNKPGDLMIELDLGLGFEQGADGLRTGSTLIVIKDHYLLVGVYEGTVVDGELTNHFYMVHAAMQDGEGHKFGVMARRFAGVGLRADFPIPGTKASIWVAPLYDFEFDQAGGFVTLHLDL